MSLSVTSGTLKVVLTSLHSSAGQPVWWTGNEKAIGRRQKLRADNKKKVMFRQQRNTGLCSLQYEGSNDSGARKLEMFTQVETDLGFGLLRLSESIW